MASYCSVTIIEGSLNAGSLCWADSHVGCYRAKAHVMRNIKLRRVDSAIEEMNN